MVTHVWWILATVMSALLYHIGGSSGYNTKIRDFGVPSVVVVCLVFLCHPIPSLLWRLLAMFLTFGLTFAASVSYYKKEGQPAKWWNWLLVGLVYGISALPYVWVTQMWTPFIIRTAFLAMATMVWSEHIEDVMWEECGRGALVVSTLILFT